MIDVLKILCFVSSPPALVLGTCSSYNTGEENSNNLKSLLMSWRLSCLSMTFPHLWGLAFCIILHTLLLHSNYNWENVPPWACSRPWHPGHVCERHSAFLNYKLQACTNVYVFLFANPRALFLKQVCPFSLKLFAYSGVHAQAERKTVTLWDQTGLAEHAVCILLLHIYNTLHLGDLHVTPAFGVDAVVLKILRLRILIAATQILDTRYNI